jgi:hypothetical protein
MEEKAKLSKWDEAIADYSSRLIKAKRAVTRLENAIATFTRHKEQSRAWPGESSDILKGDSAN